MFLILVVIFATCIWNTQTKKDTTGRANEWVNDPLVVPYLNKNDSIEAAGESIVRLRNYKNQKAYHDSMQNAGCTALKSTDHFTDEGLQYRALI